MLVPWPAFGGVGFVAQIGRSGIERGHEVADDMTAPSKTKVLNVRLEGYNVAVIARGSLPIWLDKDVCWHGSGSRKRGRRPKYSEAAIQLCLTIKGLFNLALGQVMSTAQKPIQARWLGLLGARLSTVSRRQKHLSVTIGAHTTRVLRYSGTIT